MSEVENKVNGMEKVSDDELEAVAGGAGFQRCSFGNCYESAFPETICKHCPDFEAKEFAKNEAAKQYRFICNNFKKTEWKNTDFWNFFSK